MKIIFLGTGSAAHCTRQLTSLCIVSEKKTILIDCGDGMGTVRNLLKSGVRIEDIDDIFVTHRHGDHVAGMIHFLFLKMLEKEKRIHVFGPKEAVEVVKTISLLTHDLTKQNENRIDFHPIHSSEFISVGDMIIQGIQVSHGLPETFAFSVVIGNKKIVFSSDMQPNANFEKLAKGATIVIHECFGLSEQENQWHALGHSSAKDAGELAFRIGAKQLILTHLPTRDFDVDVIQLTTEAKQYFSGIVTIAEDLMVVPF